VQAGAPVRVADVAEIQGGDVDGLGDVVVMAAAEVAKAAGPARVDLAMVRAAVEKNGKISLGRLTFSGSACVVRVMQEQTPAPVAKVAAPVKAVAKVETVRERVAARIAQTLGVAEGDLKLNFEDSTELLAMPTAGRTVAVQPAAMGDRMPINIKVYKGDALLAQGVARVGVLVRRDVVVAREELSRGDTPSAEQLDEQEQWISPSVVPAKMAEVVGAVVKGRIEGGKVVQSRDVSAPVVVAKGDLVSIDCISGTVVVGTTARAREAGRSGDVITFQSLTSKKTMTARVSGPGKAVLVVGEGSGS
jgi:flagella basal body P-ring formation protein FlgA